MGEHAAFALTDLWAEQPMYFQFLFVVDRVRAMSPQHPEWKTKEPFASLFKGRLFSRDKRAFLR